jgi:pimeloyl-ACP methyl ester carboxylesterase
MPAIGPIAFAPMLGTVALIAMTGSVSGAPGDRDTMVKVGDHHLHVHELGTGQPIVAFESGMGENVSTWTKVQPSIARLTRTLAYERAGLGRSEPSAATHARDAAQLARELHALLRAAHVPRPYVLVGHSLGGAIVQVFAHDYPTEVGGLVLVDPGDGRLDALLRTALPAEVWSAREKALAEEMPTLPIAVRNEYDGLALSGDEVSRAFPLPPVPTVLLTGTRKNPDFPGNPIEQDLKLQLHNELASKVPGLSHILVPTSRHYIQEDAPDAVISAIEQVLSRAHTIPKRRD